MKIGNMFQDANERQEYLQGDHEKTGQLGMGIFPKIWIWFKNFFLKYDDIYTS